MIFATPLLGKHVFLPLYIYGMKAMSAQPPSARERQSHRSIREKPENMTNRVFPINDTQTSSVGPLDEAAVAAKIDHMLREMTDERTALSLDVERVLQHLEASKSTESEVHAQDLGVLLAYVHDLEEHLNSKLQAILQ
ncbi:hypothetical protein DYB31_013805 [Aphanomyces astaci]|uniref:Uncharacterized protein n=1 Tax=Aphanomyces astaci TaxID=112090 RepID=A0A397EBR9_APHAT|nr:hypothetical protein DYB31_013805 [Aphanomyces astaci]